MRGWQHVVDDFDERLDCRHLPKLRPLGIVIGVERAPDQVIKTKAGFSYPI
jgi:hypothetical protein